MNKYAKWGIGILLSPFIIILLLAIALYLPPIQNWAVKTVASYASEETGMNISVEHVCLVFPLDLGVDGVLVTQKNDSLPQVTDTIASIDHLVAEVKLLPLFDNRVEIDEFFFNKMKVNTANFIHEARVKGTLTYVGIENTGTIDLGKEHIRLDKISIREADIDVALSDTVPEDTTKSETFWKIELGELLIADSKAKVHLPGDTLQIEATMGKLQAKKGYLDLYKNLYDIETIAWQNGGLKLDNNFEPHVKGLDTNHIDLSDINIGIDSLHFLSPDIALNIRECKMKEKSGIALENIDAKVRMDAEKLLVKGDIATQHSTMNADIDMDLNTFEEKNPGIILANIDASLGKQDILLALGDMPRQFSDQMPASPLQVKISGKGNLRHVDIKEAYAQLPTAFTAKVTGYADNPMDMDRIKAALKMDLKTQNMAFVNGLLSQDMQKTINIPAMQANASVNINGRNYDGNFSIKEGNGSLNGKGRLNSKAMSYTADIDANAIQLQHFVKGMGLGGFSGKASIAGNGTNPFSPSTKITAQASVNHLTYDRWNLNNINLDAILSNGKADATLEAHNELLDGTVGFNGLLSRNPIQATLTADVKTVDFYAMRITDKPYTFGGCAHIDMATDLKDYYYVLGTLSDVTMQDSAKTYRPDDLELDLLTRTDTTHLVANCGDFFINADIQGGYKAIMGIADRMQAEIKRQIDSRIIDEAAFRQVLPQGKVSFNIGTENPIYRMAKFQGYDFANVEMNMTSSKVEGINGYLNVDTLSMPGMQLDKIRLNLTSDEERMGYVANIENGPDNPQYCFYAEARGTLHPNGTNLAVAIDDKNHRRGVNITLEALMEEEGVRLMFADHNQILGFKDFSVNEDNYVFLSRDMRVSANVRLKTNDGEGIMIYTDDENLEALQDITFSLHQFELRELLSVLPYTPRVSGVLNGDFHVIITPEDLSVSSAVDFRNLIYEGSKLGNLSSEFVYVPQNDGSHYIDGILSKDDMEIGTIVGSYNPEGEGAIDAVLSMRKFPLNLVNGFIPDQLIGLEGTGDGDLTLKGSLSKPDVNGEIMVEGASLFSVPYGITMRINDDPVVIEDSKFTLNDFRLYANNEQPLIINGSINFSDLNHLYMDMRIRAENFLMIDAKETKLSEAYGKGYVNFFAMATGELNKLRVRGRIDVLSNTNLFYILKDSPITTDNRLKELVTFTDLSGDEPITMTRPVVDGLDVSIAVNIAEGAHVKCWLNTDHTNYLDIVGNGDLRLGYASGEMTLRGKYTITEGEMKYSLPIIPLKTFHISQGSFLEFTGDMMNPRLSISATEKNRAPVIINETSQMVAFNCGVKISKTLKDMGLEFIIESPENQTISDELKSKTLEERGKLAVTMLTTGMYLTENNTSSFTMNSALNSFLQQEINNIAGSALRTLDISVGLENNTDASGHTHLDYSFKFAKRFWNNRLSISVGGKISTGPDVTGQNNTFFDNVEVQYRTSAASNQYLQLFYKRAVYDYLEGYVGEYGAGYMWKRKLQNFRDIFQFGDKDLSLPVTRRVEMMVPTDKKEATSQSPPAGEESTP